MYIHVWGCGRLIYIKKEKASNKLAGIFSVVSAWSEYGDIEGVTKEFDLPH